MSRKDKSCSREPVRRGFHGATCQIFGVRRRISAFRRIAGMAQERSCLLPEVDNGGRKEVQPQCQCDRSSLRNRSCSSAWRSPAACLRLLWNRPAALLPVCQTPKPHLAQNNGRYFSGLRQLRSNRRSKTKTTRAIQAKAGQTEWQLPSRQMPATFSFLSCGPRPLAPYNRQPEKEMAAPGVNNGPTLPQKPKARPTAVLRKQEQSRMLECDALAAA